MKEPIQGVSRVFVGETLTPTEALSHAQREVLARWLKETYLNELCRGQAVFRPGNEDSGPGLTG